MSAATDHEVVDAAPEHTPDVDAAPEQTPDVEPEPSKELAVAAPAEHAELAIVPPDQEMRALVQLAVTLSAADLVPKALREKPNDVLLVLLTARDLGIKLTTALRLCHPIDGQVTVAPKLKLAIIRERGLGKVWPDPANDEQSATWYAVRADDPDTTFASTYTWADAQRAGLVRHECSPDQHTDACTKGQSNRNTGAKCKSNWYSYPARMLSWRALGYLMDDAFGEVGAGLYSPDELGAITDEEGHAVIDVTDVGPLEGTAEPRSMAQARRRAERGPNPGDELAPEADRQLIDRMLRALPEQGVTEARRLWPEAVGYRVAELPTKRVKNARALAASLWKRAAGGEWGTWEPPFDPDSPSEAADGPESGSGGEHPETPAEPQSEPQSDRSGDADGTSDDELPDLDDLDAVIDWVQALSLLDVDRYVERHELTPEGEAEGDRRRAVALHLASSLDLL